MTALIHPPAPPNTVLPQQPTPIGGPRDAEKTSAVDPARVGGEGKAQIGRPIDLNLCAILEADGDTLACAVHRHAEWTPTTLRLNLLKEPEIAAISPKVTVVGNSKETPVVRKRGAPATAAVLGQPGFPPAAGYRSPASLCP